MIENNTFVKPLVEDILRHYHDHDWTVQGFGMIRTYLGPKGNTKAIRLNIWDSRMAVPGVSTIHDHPWDFDSLIVAGVFVNLRYVPFKPNSPSRYPAYATHSYMEIATGVAGDNSESARKARDQYTIALAPATPETYITGEVYRQNAAEIHESLPKDGTVTINSRVGDTEKARVFWPIGTNWVDAKPRAATSEEVRLIARDALLKWF